MRGNMDPLAPTTHTLGPAIAHIAETAASLSSTMDAIPAKPQGLGLVLDPTSHATTETPEIKIDSEKEKQKNTVLWVLNTPRRLQHLIDQEREEEAERDWEEISRILDQWQGVKGAKELRDECEEIMRVEEESAEEE